MSNQATARATVGSLLQSVASTANMVTNVVNGVSKSGELFSNFMSATLEKQQIDQVHELSIYAITSKEQAVKTLADSRKEISDFINASEANATIYKTAEDDLDKAIAARLNPKGK